MSNLYWLTEEQMARFRPYFPKSPGKPQVDDRRVLSGIVLVNRNGLRWRDAPSDYGPYKTLYNRWKRWGEMGAPPHDGPCALLGHRFTVARIRRQACGPREEQGAGANWNLHPGERGVA